MQTNAETAAPGRVAPRWSRGAAWLAFAAPLAVTAYRASPAPQWRDDLAVVRGLGLVPVGGEGMASSLLMQAMALVPLGGRQLRAALVSAVCLALASLGIYLLAARVLATNARTPRLTPALALAAALLATLAPTWQLEGTIAGGATVAAALVLAGLLLRPEARGAAAGALLASGDARVWLGFGGLIGAALAESHAAGCALVAAVALQAGALHELPTRRSVALLVGGAVAVAAVCLVPVAIRPLAARSWVDLGLDLSTTNLTALDTAAGRGTAVGAWLDDVGLVSVVLACVGGAWGLARGKTRWMVAPLLVFVVADAVFPASRGGALAADSLAALRLLAVAAVSICATLGVQTAMLLLQTARIPMASPAAVLLAAFDFALVLVASEDSSHVADHRSRYGAEVWTDEALGGLPPDSLLLVRSQAVAWRLWSARVVRGERPDLVVVPVPLLERGSVASRLLELEPALGPIIREIALDGRPNEYALSTLADARRLYVELDPTWDPRLVDHVTPEPLWLRFAPQALGRSDRRAALERGRRPYSRALAAARTPGSRDEATLAILGARTREQAYALAALGDRRSVRPLLEDLRTIDPGDGFADELEARLGHRRRGRVDVAGLLR